MTAAMTLGERYAALISEDRAVTGAEYAARMAMIDEMLDKLAGQPRVAQSIMLDAFGCGVLFAEWEKRHGAAL